MPITFGSVGDVIAVCLLVKDLVNALDEARGSKAEYHSVIRELWILDRALLEIELLSIIHGNGSTPELRGLCETAHRAATKCRDLIADFLRRIRKYKSSFDDGSPPGLLKKTAMSIRWHAGEREALERFRVQVAGTSSSLQMLLATANVNLLSINRKEVNNQLDQIEQRHQQQDSNQNALLLDLKGRIDDASQHITEGNTTLSNIKDALRLDWFRQLGADLKSLMHRAFAANIATYHAVVSIQTVLSTRLERTLIDEPFILEDPIGRTVPVHLQFITSWDSFDAVLEVRFRDVPGYRKIRGKQYSLQEKATGRDIDTSRPWQGAFLPGQHVDMSILFRSAAEMDPSDTESTKVTCPGCKFGSSESADIDIHCSNCKMWFRRITVITDEDTPASRPLSDPWESGWVSFPRPGLGNPDEPLNPRKRRAATNHLCDGDEEEDVRMFKRVRLISERKRTRRQQSFIMCPHCNERPDGFRGTHELDRHVARAHTAVRKGFICVDASPDKIFLADCRHCRNKKVYGAYYNAAAHLRRAHFHPRKRGRKDKYDEKRGGIGAGDDPPMDYLKQHWMREIEVENTTDSVSFNRNSDYSTIKTPPR